MSEKMKIQQFVNELDACLKSGEVPQTGGRPQEHTDLLKLGLVLSGRGGVNRGQKAAALRHVWDTASAEDAGLRTKPRRVFVKTGGILAASCLLAMLLLAPTSFAGDWMRSVIRTVSLGHITVSQMQPLPAEAVPFPDELKGKMFTKEGKPVEQWEGQEKPFYTANGEEIAGVANGEIITKKEMEAQKAVPEAISITDPAAIPQYVAFTAGLPAQLPEGFVFDRAQVYSKDSKYLDIYYVNPATGKTIYIQERLADEETAYATSTDDTVEKAEVAGAGAVIVGSKSIDWEKDGVLYSIMTGKSSLKLDNSQLIKMAESVKPVPAE